MKHILWGLVVIGIVFPCSGVVHAIGQQQYVEFSESPGSFCVVQNDRVATLYVDFQDWPGVARAVGDLQTDVDRVSGRTAPIANGVADLRGNAIIVGTIGKSRAIDQLIRDRKIDVSAIEGQWESFLIQVVPEPLPGVAQGLVIAGSDKRGTVYGIYDLSEQMGVSPWYWWGDVPVEHRDAVYVKAGTYRQGPPSVKYRGMFINDEAPDLSNWVAWKYGRVPQSEDPPIPGGVANYNSEFYAKVFESILRCKGNYLWPAMWNNAFNEDDPNNARLADLYGIVMGTSHQEPMLRAQKEWDRRYQQTLGSWNYYQNPEVLQDFWRAGIQRNKDYESIITIGLRGANDTPMIRGGTVAESMALLEKIVDVQRNILAEEMDRDVAQIPQLWCLYKEVQEYYHEGLRVPDDVTLLWADDNWGNVRRLPTDAERERPGGAGIYYHFDYVGGPRNYKWINTISIPRVWEQMSQAKTYGADRIWIVNVGHFKHVQFPVEFFLNLGWNTDRWTNENVDDFTRMWAEREFGPAYAEEIAEIMTQYMRFNARRKPELLDPSIYSVVDYREADTVVADYNALVARAEAINEKLPEEAKDAFYDFVLFPTKACAQVNELYVAAAKNALYAEQGRVSANDMADKVEELFQADADLMDYYNTTFAGGKWNHFQDQTHIGYTSWQEPRTNNMPRVTRVDAPQAAGLGVAVEGSSSAWPGTEADPCLPTFDTFNRQRYYIDVFNRGQAPFQYRAVASEPWIRLSASEGTVDKGQRLWVSIDWSTAPKGTADATVSVSREGGRQVTVKVKTLNPTEVTRESLDGFVESNGHVSIEAEHYTKNVPSEQASWQKIDDYGRTLSGMTPLPMTAPSVTPPAAPCLEYKMYLFSSGEASVQSIISPTLNFVPGRGLRYAVSFDDEAPQIVEILPADFDPQNGNRQWENAVRNACHVARSTHTLSGPGYHTLKIWMVDPAVVLEKVVIDLGGLKPNYLGPPESAFFEAEP